MEFKYEVGISALIDAHRERVFDAFRDRAHIDEWWGPKVATMRTTVMDIKPGGLWKYELRSATGQTYPLEFLVEEVVRPQRLSYYQEDYDVDEHRLRGFKLLVTFEDKGRQTDVTMHMIYMSEAEQQQQKALGAENAIRETLERLNDYLAKKR